MVVIYKETSGYTVNIVELRHLVLLLNNNLE